MQETEVVERLVENEQRSKSNSKRLDGIENKVENIYDLTLSVREIATEMKAMREDQNKMNERLKIIEEKPAKEYEETKKQIKSKVVSFFVGIILTAIAFILGLSKFV
jgi:tetrahydromethanopterin S-methyltransferase subunit G